MKDKLLATIAISAATIFWPENYAHAQDASAEGADNTVVVTGSLIARRNYVAASPIVVQSAEDLKQTGVVNLEQALNQLPGFTPAGGASTGGQGTGGHATVNLHGLGANRNLVLLDGRRLPLSDISGNVDINFIPDSILSGVETITGGASAVYGSDAMSGVVNFRTINFFEGLRVDAMYGDTFVGDFPKWSGSVAVGAASADDKGHIVVSVGMVRRDGMFGRDRGFFLLSTPSAFIGQGTYVPDAANLPSQASLNSVFASYGGTGTVSRTGSLGFNDDGTLFTQTGARNYRGPTDPMTTSLGDISRYAVIAGNVRQPAAQQQQIQNPLDRSSIYSKFDYQIADNVNLYGQLIYVDSSVYTNSGGSLTQYGNLPMIPVTNPFIPANLRTILATRTNATAPFMWNGRYIGVPYKAFDEQYTVTQYLAGAKGDVGVGDWTYDAFTAYDSTRHNQTMLNAVLKDRVANLLNAADGGASICAGGFNPFGRAAQMSLSQACRDYITANPGSTEELNQFQVQGIAQGSLFELPAGPVSLAVLAGYRRNAYKFSPDKNLASQNVESILATAASRGAIGVTEGAVQVDVPILSEQPFFHQLNLGAAYRYSDYTTSGSVTSYEGDVKWRPVSPLLLRASYQRAVRAPNIGELFAAPAGSPLQFGTPPAAIGDPCDVRSIARTGPTGAGVRGLCLAQGIPAALIDTYTFPTTNTSALVRGNTALTPEEADTYNIGMVWNSDLESPLLNRMSLSVDYYNIKIDQAISPVPGLTVLSKCYNQDGTNPTYSPTNQFCRLVNRNSQGLMDFVDAPYLNLGGYETDGVEVQFDWTGPLDALGMPWLGESISFSTAVGYVNSFKVQTLPGTKFDDFAGTNTSARTYPKWKALTTVSYNNGPVNFGVRWRYQDGMKDVTSVTTPASPGVGVNPYHLADIFGSVDIRENVELRVGVNNVGDEPIPFVASATSGTDPGTFDVVGRAFYVGLRLEM